jgi:L-lactate dehydrogenase complex protein LldF
LRERQVERGLRPWYETLALRVWGWTAQHPRLYGLATAVGVRYLRTLRNSDGMIGSIPFASGWTRTRFMPAPSSGKTFRGLYALRKSR